MLKHPRRKYILNKIGDIAHRSLIVGCIGLSIYGLVGISVWFYNFHFATEEEKQKVLLKKIDTLKNQDGLEIRDKAKDLST
ncbi:hypothetical protein M8J76_011704 [Diaphorina citri]|nr:hypothetical protein M8J75_013761 [Diaphorina citri]KAI5722663.1 hypothetical protein M8J76_011704 [Diaphorina citri]KAI5725301.1 hypothetical protein M8J77_013591 [Diaphorina citri]